LKRFLALQVAKREKDEMIKQTGKKVMNDPQGKLLETINNPGSAMGGYQPSPYGF